MAGIESPTPAPPPDEPGAGDDDRGYEVPNRPWLVHGAIIVAFGIFIFMVMLLFVRWIESNEPNASMIFIGDERLDRVQVRIDGPKMDKAVTQELSKENNYQARFAMPAGTYLVRIRRDGEILVSDTTVVAREGIGSQQYDLIRLLKLEEEPATRPQP